MMNNIFNIKKGDVVVYYKKPSSEDWIGIGEVDIPFKLGQKYTVETIQRVSSAPDRFMVATPESTYWYPVSMFKPVRKKENINNK